MPDPAAPQTAAQLLPQAIARLRAAGRADAPNDARRLMAHALGSAPDRLSLMLHDPITQDAAARFEAAIAARIAGQPVAQITGQRLFWGRVFEVTRDTLDPRPETEILIARALELAWGRFADLGTGTGAIGLTLLAERPTAQAVLTDLSDAALAVAGRNAARLGVSARLAQGDWCAPLDGQFDLIVSNPPYIARDEMPALSPEVREWEPHLALTDDGDGLGAYRKIAACAPQRLTAGGTILLEIGPTQAQTVAALFTARGGTTRCHHDFDGRPRVIEARFAHPPALQGDSV